MLLVCLIRLSYARSPRDKTANSSYLSTTIRADRRRVKGTFRRIGAGLLGQSTHVSPTSPRRQHIRRQAARRSRLMAGCKIAHKMRPVAQNLRPVSRLRCADPPQPAPTSPRRGRTPRDRGPPAALRACARHGRLLTGLAQVLCDKWGVGALYRRLSAHVMCPTASIQAWGRRILCAFLHPGPTGTEAR